MTRRGPIILGAGGHARVVADALCDLSMPASGCLAPSAPSQGLPGDPPWLGPDEYLDTLAPQDWLLVNGTGSTRDTRLRQRCFEQARARGFGFMRLIHPRACVSTGASLDIGAQVMPGAIVQTGARLGANVLVNTGAIVGHDASIGAHVHVAPGAILSGGVTIGQGVHVGAGAVIREGVTVGQDALIGAGAVVLRDVAAGARLAGNPARSLPR